ncbi:MAG: UDP-N-acetylglucosamine--N-acetylmuramyl-(pentapeptide) pyrophosphoryl-undecaprenol N-acetylglucosamine transferase [Deltaproteobacteria bacterium]|nr:UDP-N-acetylglucosamine--N-acetylmuramyl-(pentapeptide) pyrophosphoryl-undecaprenol N-acetylglucosamine transferase [Deltaproteobacteria bacterium]
MAEPGGHVFPGIAVADALDRRTRDLSVCWVGTSGHRGARATDHPVALRGVGSRPQRGARRKLVEALAAPPRGGAQAWRVLRERPHVVLGVGGYAGGPIVAMAAAMRLPTAVLEPNAVPGMTNRILSRVVKRAFVTHEETLSAFPAGVGVVTGSPVRRAFLARMALGGSGGRGRVGAGARRQPGGEGDQ